MMDASQTHHIGHAARTGEAVTESTSSLNGPAATVTRQDKLARIEAACKAQNVPALAQHATSPLGFVTDDCRRLAWPILLGCDTDSLTAWEKLPSASEVAPKPAWEDLPAHSEEHQAGLDVDRSFVYYPKEGESQLASRKKALLSLIIQTLRQYPYLHYFQGYHDIAQVFLLVLGHDKAVSALARLSILRIRDFMLPSIEAAKAQLALLPSILRVADPKLEKHLCNIRPEFAISATLTLYAHNIEEYGDISRLFDFFLAQPATVPLYLYAVVIRSREDELLEMEPDEPDILFAILSKLPKALDLDRLILETMELYNRYPPGNLPGSSWRSIDNCSVLKTTQNVPAIQEQRLEQGKIWFKKQQRKLQRDETLQRIKLTLYKYRRPARSVGIAVTIAVLAWWLRRDGHASMLLVWPTRHLRGVLG